MESREEELQVQRIVDALAAAAYDIARREAAAERDAREAAQTLSDEAEADE